MEEKIVCDLKSHDKSGYVQARYGGKIHRRKIKGSAVKREKHGP
jgi:hypothetical protein